MSEHAHSTPLPPARVPEGTRFARAHHVLLYFLLAAVVVWLLSGFYRVQTDQVAIVERLGQYLSTPQGDVLKVGHGLHYHLPWPIDRVNVVSVQQRYPLQISEFNASPAAYADFKRDLIRRGNDPAYINALFDPYVITADRSVIHVEINVLFSIADPLAWVKSISHEYSQNYDPAAAADMRNALFQQIAQRAIISQVGRTGLQQALRSGRADLERAILNAFQKGLDVPDPSDPTGSRNIQLGVVVQSVNLSVAQVPDAVKPAYDNLINTVAGAQSAISSAAAEKEAMIARAQSDTSTLLAQARIDAENSRQAANGEAERFKLVLEQYYQAPEITRWNLYVDAVRAVSGGAKRIYFAVPGQRTVIVVDPPQPDAAQAQPGR